MSRRTALVLTPRLPWPLDDGGRVVLWQSLWAAARTHDIALITFVPRGQERDPIPDPIRRLATAAVITVPFRPPALPVAAWRGLIGEWPYTIGRYQDPAFAREVEHAVGTFHPEFALVNNLHLAPYVGALGCVPMVLREQNAEHRWMERYARDRGAAPEALYARGQAARLKRVERELCERAVLVLAIQERESAALRALAPRARVRTLPIGVDLARFREPSPADPPVVLLPGSFEWLPNTEGAIRFLEEGWSHVRAQVPEARLRVAGKNPPPVLRAAATRAGADLAANVPSMEEELARATVVLVPLWLGAGARVKIVEAMAARAPVVATPVAAEGLDLEPETHYQCAETPPALAQSVASLLRDPAERLRLGAQGRALAEERWSLEGAARLQEILIGEALRTVGAGVSSPAAASSGTARGSSQ